MGENKASYMMKDAIGKVPENDQKVGGIGAHLAEKTYH